MQSGVPNPSWTSGDFLGYDGAGRMIAKRYLNPGGGAALVGFTTEYDRSGNKFFERALHAENRSHLYEPFDPTTNLPLGGFDSLDRLLQYNRGTLDPSIGFDGNGGGAITIVGGVPQYITLPGTDAKRSYLLDGLGNWRNTAFTPVAGAAQTEVRQHNGLNQITQRQNPAASHPPVNPTYDRNGNLTDDGVLNYTWDALNRLVGGGPNAHYVYDALDRRIRKTVSGVVTDCLYSGWRCVEDRDVSDNPIAQYVWGIYLDEIIQQKNLTALNDFDMGAVLYPLQDLLYRTTALADTSPMPVLREAYDFDAYGNTLIFRNASGGVVTAITFSDGDALAAAATCPFLFTGQRFDPETSLYYCKRRYYAPALGRFLSRDPIGNLAGDKNLYRYMENDPVGATDPLGLDKIESEKIPVSLGPIANAIEEALKKVGGQLPAPGEIFLDTKYDLDKCTASISKQDTLPEIDIATGSIGPVKVKGLGLSWDISADVTANRDECGQNCHQCVITKHYRVIRKLTFGGLTTKWIALDNGPHGTVVARGPCIPDQK